MQNSATLERPLRIGIFRTIEGAERAVTDLLAAGFSKDQITVMCSDQTKERYFREFEHQPVAGTTTSATTVAGGAIGAALGGLGVIATAITTGGMALWAAGPISAWAGGVVGGLVGAMMSRGVEKELANYYQQAVLEGQLLVAAEDTGPNQRQMLAKAARILAAAGAEPLPLQEG
jgi:hypothetical protein